MSELRNFQGLEAGELGDGVYFLAAIDLVDRSMYPTNPHIKKEVLVVGAGMAGLSSALLFQRRFPGCRVRVLYSEKTPTIRPSMIRNAAMYCETFSFITSHPAMTTMTVRKVVRMISGMDMPSMPMW